MHGQPYDLQFVTYLRHILTMGKEMNQTKMAKPCAQWVDSDQSIFIITNRQEFSRRWYTFKVINSPYTNLIHVLFSYRALYLIPGTVCIELSSQSSSTEIFLRSSLVTSSSKCFALKSFLNRCFVWDEHFHPVLGGDNNPCSTWLIMQGVVYIFTK